MDPLQYESFKKQVILIEKEIKDLGVRRTHLRKELESVKNDFSSVCDHHDYVEIKETNELFKAENMPLKKSERKRCNICDTTFDTKSEIFENGKWTEI